MKIKQENDQLKAEKHMLEVALKSLQKQHGVVTSGEWAREDDMSCAACSVREWMRGRHVQQQQGGIHTWLTHDVGVCVAVKSGGNKENQMGDDEPDEVSATNKPRPGLCFCCAPLVCVSSLCCRHVGALTHSTRLPASTTRIHSHTVVSIHQHITTSVA